MKAPFKRFTVHTEANDSSRFHIYVSDLAGILALFSDKKSNFSAEDNHRFSLERALFIEQAIQKAIDEAQL